MSADQTLAALERLARLKADGILTDAEFAAEKAAVLAGKTGRPMMLPAQSLPPPPPTVLPPTIIYAQPPQPRRSRVRRALRYAGIAFLVSLTFEAIKYIPRSGGTATVARCDSGDARDVLKDAFEHSVAEREANVRLLDVANMVERSYDPGKAQRICAADVTLNTGDEHIGYRLYQASNGQDLLLQTMDDPGASPATVPAATPTASGERRDAPVPPQQPGEPTSDVRRLSKDQQDLLTGVAMAQALTPPTPRLPCVRNAAVPEESAQALTCLNNGRRYTMPASIAGLPTSYRAVDHLPDEDAPTPATPDGASR